MKRLEARFRPEALGDLSEIYNRVRQLSGNANTARVFVLRIRERCERIGDAPFGGRSPDDLEKGLRTVPFERSAVIAYKVENDGFIHAFSVLARVRRYVAFLLASGLRAGPSGGGGDPARGR